MKLEEMGLVGRQVKLTDDAPSHAGEVGRIVSMSTERVYVQFSNGDKEWFANKWIVGTRKTDVQEDALMEMAAKATCSKCGRGPVSKTHHWYKGEWKCKAGKADDKPVEKKEEPNKDADPKKHKTAAELGLTKHEPPKQSESMRKANEEAATKRAITFRDQLEKDIAAREAKKKK